MSKAPKRSRGRPPTEGETLLKPITIRLPPSVMTEIDELVIAGEREGADKSSVLRRIIAKGLDAMRGRK